MRNQVRFYHFSSMTARRNSTGCVNGKDHEIKKGDHIGWSRKHRIACCESCWVQWRQENADADAYEAGYGYIGWPVE